MVRVVRAGGLVQNEDGRVFQKYAGNGDALLLPAGKLDAALAHIGVVAAVQRRDELVRAGQLCGLLHLGAGGVRTPVEDVFVHGSAEQINVLLHDADGPAQGFQRYGFHIAAVDAHMAGRCVVKTGNEVAQRRLAAAGRPYESQLFTGAHIQA